MTRFLQLLDRTIDVGLFFVLAFTPLAFGAVEEWAQAIAQIAVFLVVTAWVLKLTWSPAPWRGPTAPRAVLGGRILVSGLELPALAFAVVVLLQLIPLPPSVLRMVSPRSAGIYAQSLPGYGESADPSFAELPRWLQSDPGAEAGGVPALPPDPDRAAAAMPAEVFNLPHPAWRPISLTPAHTWRALQIFLAHAMLFIVVFNHVADRRLARSYLLLLAGLSGIVALIGILQELTADGHLYWWRASNTNYAFGPFFNANSFAGWMEMALPVCAGTAVMVWERQRREAGGAGGLLEQAGRPFAAFVLLSFITILGLCAFVIAKSRGGILALGGAAMILLGFYAAKGWLRARVLIPLFLVCGAAVAMAVWIDWQGLRARYETLGDVQADSSFRSRLAFSKRTLDLAADFPALGTGLGTFEEAYYLYAPGTSSKVLGRAHNDYVQVVAECGVVGFLAALWGLVLLLKNGVVPGIVRRGSASRWPVRGAALGVLALLLHSFVDFNLQIYANSVLFVFLCAFLLRDRVEGPPGGRRR